MSAFHPNLTSGFDPKLECAPSNESALGDPRRGPRLRRSGQATCPLAESFDLARLPVELIGQALQHSSSTASHAGLRQVPASLRQNRVRLKPLN